MWEYMSRRARECAEYILETGATVRDCANHLGISKSTVHKDVTERLYEVDKELYTKVRKVLDKNLSERHIRGGIATRNKYLSRRSCECRADKNAKSGNNCARCGDGSCAKNGNGACACKNSCGECACTD